MSESSHERLGNDSHLKRYNNLLDMIGDKENPTPIVALHHISLNPDAQIFVKLEWMNAFGSIKDRPAKWMLDKLEERGELGTRTVVEATSGNTGIALAAIASLMGKEMIATAPHNLSPEKLALLRMFGAEVIHTPKVDAAGRHPMDVAFSMADAIVAASDDGCVMPNQYDNPDNPLAHYETTGPEIWAQTEGKIDYFFAGFGTCGTVVGTGRYLKEQNPNIKVIGIEPRPGHHISGLKNMTETAEPGNLTRNRDVVDEIVYVDDAETDETVLKVYREEALMIGPSASAILAGALKYMADKDGIAVVIAPDSGQKAASYLMAVLGM